MDSILLSDSSRVVNGLEDLMDAALGTEGEGYAILGHHVSIDQALILVKLAASAPDRHDWFPRGKWATIQAIQDRIDTELALPIARLKAMEEQP